MQIVELIGLAGAGKSTVARRLLHSNNRIAIEEPPYFRKLRDVPFFALNALLCLPTFLRQFTRKTNDRYLKSEEIAWIVLLEGWHRRLRRQAANGSRVIVLDQGPVFFLMLLQLYGPASFKWPNMKGWWLRTAGLWANVLDTAIWLDAPDDVLVRRIRARQRWHGVKDRSDEQALAYLRPYRTAFDEVTSILTTSRQNFEVVRVNTGAESQEQTVDRVLSALGLGRNGFPA